MEHMIITIGGYPGAGKTTLADLLAKELGYGQLYMGGIFRAMAEKKGISIEQFYEELKDDPEAEQTADGQQAELMRTKDDIIVQGRVAWHFAKGSPFKVFNIMLTVDPKIAAQRAGSRKENAGRTPAQIAAADAERVQTERQRYAMLYGIKDHLDPAHYDFVLDTTILKPEEALARTMSALAAVHR